MHRIRASAALLLTAFFAVAGSFHIHPIPKPAHDHAGFCSAASPGLALESCALCKAANTPFHLTALVSAPARMNAVSHRVRSTAPARRAGGLFLRDSRAPPRA